MATKWYTKTAYCIVLYKKIALDLQYTVRNLVDTKNVRPKQNVCGQIISDYFGIF